MTPAEEDVLYEEFDNDRHSVIGTRGAFLVAIRAAVAQGRERCAKVCEELHKQWQGGEVAADEYLSPMDCAAAIRRGE